MGRCRRAGAAAGPLTRRTVIVPDIETGQPPWVSNPATATVRRIDPRRNQVTDDMAEADGSDLTVAANGVVWATGGTRLLGLGVGSQVLGPRRDLHALGTDRITATAAARDGGLWLGTPQGLFHINRSVLRAGGHPPAVIWRAPSLPRPRGAWVGGARPTARPWNPWSGSGTGRGAGRSPPCGG